MEVLKETGGTELITTFFEALKDVLYKFCRTPFVLEKELYLYIFASFLVCQVLYKVTHWLCTKYLVTYKTLPFVEQLEWQTRVTSTAHALVVFPIVLTVLLTDVEYNNNVVHGRNHWSDFAMAVGVGYFLSDSVVVISNWIPPVAPIIAHHVFAGWGFLLAIGNHGGGRWFGTYLLLTEATAPFNNTYWKLCKSGMESSLIAKIMGHLFAFNWLVFRILINPFLILQVYRYGVDILRHDLYTFLVFMINIVFLILLNTIFFFIGPFYGIVFGSKETKQIDQPKKGKKSE